MLFQVTHLHTHESCPGVVKKNGELFGQWWQALKENQDLKVIGGYVCPTDHTFHITIEASDYAPVARALGPLNSIGTGQVTPVITLDQALPLADEGTFRLPDQN